MSTRKPTPAQRRAILAAIENGGTFLPGTAHPRTLTALVSAGWATRATATHEVTDAGRQAMGWPVEPVANPLRPEPGSGAATCVSHGPLCPHPSRCGAATALDDTTAPRTMTNPAMPSTGTREVESLTEDVTVQATMFDPELTYYADGTRVVMTAQGTTREGIAAGRIGGAPYAFQVVRWEDGATDNVAPHVLSLASGGTGTVMVLDNARGGCNKPDCDYQVQCGECFVDSERQYDDWFARMGKRRSHWRLVIANMREGTHAEALAMNAQRGRDVVRETTSTDPVAYVHLQYAGDTTALCLVRISTTGRADLECTTDPGDATCPGCEAEWARTMRDVVEVDERLPRIAIGPRSEVVERPNRVEDAHTRSWSRTIGSTEWSFRADRYADGSVRLAAWSSRARLYGGQPAHLIRISSAAQ